MMVVMLAMLLLIPMLRTCRCDFFSEIGCLIRATSSKYKCIRI
jgi:hypothetical protein